MLRLRNAFWFCLAILWLSGCVGTPSLTPTVVSLATAPPAASPTPLPILPLPPLPAALPKIDRHPAPADWRRPSPSSVPTYHPDSDQQWQVDLRFTDLTNVDLSGSLKDLLYADFDDGTQWPPAERMPKNFDWKRIMELGKDPGLGMRQLHTQGITGRGVGIAIIDQTLLVDHQEYKDQIRLYEELDDIHGEGVSMHGPAVASIAVGKTVGVAPEADLYYIATAMGGGTTLESLDFSYLARGIRRILEINRTLPPERRIRVIAMQIGWDSTSKGYDEITAAVQDAQKAGLLLVYSTMQQMSGFKFHGLGRAPLADPDAFESYEPGIWWTKEFYARYPMSDRLLVPMDSRTTASPTGNTEYVFYREGGWSWSIPYIAGAYALAAQVSPSITPGEFWAAALKTGRTIQLKHDGKDLSFGPILDPAALIQALPRK